MAPCTTCLDPDGNCCDELYGSYSLVGQAYLNDVTGFGPNCPDGFICGPTGPGPGEPPWDPPNKPPDCPGGGCAGNGFTIVLASCLGPITRTVPYGTSDEAYLIILQSMLTERHQNQLQCDDFGGTDDPGGGPKPPVVYHSVQQQVSCAGVLTNNGTVFPPGVSLSSPDLFLAAGMFTSTVSQAAADSASLSWLSAFYALHLGNNTLLCDIAWTYFGQFRNVGPVIVDVDPSGSNMPGSVSLGALAFDFNQVFPFVPGFLGSCDGPPAVFGKGIQTGPNLTVGGFPPGAYLELGPFATDKIITVAGAAATQSSVSTRGCIGTAQVTVKLSLGAPFYCGCDGVTDCGPDPNDDCGGGDLCGEIVCWTNPTDYTGDFSQSGTAVSGYSISGKLIAGEIMRVTVYVVQVQFQLNSENLHPITQIDGAITVVDA